MVTDFKIKDCGNEVDELRSYALATIHSGTALNFLITKNGEYCLQ